MSFGLLSLRFSYLLWYENIKLNWQRLQGAPYVNQRFNRQNASSLSRFFEVLVSFTLGHQTPFYGKEELQTGNFS